MVLARKNITRLIPYQAGKPIEEVKRELGLKEVIKLASNENPLGPSPKARLAINKAIKNINRYPEGSCFYLRQALSRKLKIKPQRFIFGNGSDELIDIIIKTFVEDDENIVTAQTTFLEYEIIAKTLGRRVIKVRLSNFTYDLQAMLKRINAKTKAIFIANPNNPTGTYVSGPQLDKFLKQIPARIIVVLDGAYDAFVDVADFPKSFKYLNRSNLIILKTFSKAYGLAGLRIGYAIASDNLISYMERARPPFNVNILAQAGAVAALSDKKFLGRTRRVVLKGKKYLYSQLERAGLNFVPSVANFILIEVPRTGRQFCNQLLRYGVIARDMQQYGLNNFIRVTIGRKKENQRFVEALNKVLRKRGRR